MQKELTGRIRAVEARHAEQILRAIGAEPTGGSSHMRCPMPGHDDRNPSFRYDPKAARCFCSCRTEGITLTDVVAEVRGLDFMQAVREVSQITGEQILTNGHAKPRSKANGKPTPEQDAQAKQAAEEKARQDAEHAAEQASKIRWIEGELQRLQPIANTPAETYLRNHRDLGDVDLQFPDLGFMPDYCVKPEGRMNPALVAICRNPDGQVTGMQGVLLNHDGSPRRDQKGQKVKLSCGSIRDGFVTLRHTAAACVAIAEGIETGLTRMIAGPAEVRVCLGGLREIGTAGAEGRVELIADADKVQKARAMAREVAKAQPDLQAYVVAMPRVLGKTADLNDVLAEQGSEAVAAVVDDAERIHAKKPRPGKELGIGSDAEVAGKVLEHLENLFGTVIISEGAAWIFDGRIWTPLDDNRLSRHIQAFDGSTYMTPSGSVSRYTVTQQKVTSVRALLFSTRESPDFFGNAATGIATRNGFISFREQPDGTFKAVLLPHARKQRARHMVDCDWQEKRGPDFEAGFHNSDLKTLLDGLFSAEKTYERMQVEQPDMGFSMQDALQDQQDRTILLLELAAAAALGYGTRLRYPKAAIFLGSGSAGKTKTGELISSLVDQRAVTSISPNAMGDRFGLARMRGVVLNIAQETGGRAMSGEAFKRVITGDLCQGEAKFQNPFDFHPTAQHIFTCNDLPTFAGGVDTGIARRILIVPFDNVFAETAAELGQDGKNQMADEGLVPRIVANELHFLLDLVVDAACGLLQRGSFTNPQTSEIAKSAWMVDSDRVRGWAAERLELAPNRRATVSELYADFRNWWVEQGLTGTMPAKNSFSRRLKVAEPGLISGPNSAGACFLNAKLR